MTLRTLFFAFLFSSTFAVDAGSEGSLLGEKQNINILFIGNSFTARHNLPGLVRKVLEEGQPGLSVYAQQFSYGGQDLFRHWTYYSSQSAIEQANLEEDTFRDRILTMEETLKLENTPAEFTDYWQTVHGSVPGKEFSIVQKRIEVAIKRHQVLLKASRKPKWDYVVLQSWQDIVPVKDRGYSLYASKFADLANQQGAKVILYITAPYVQNAEPVEGPQLKEKVEMELTAARKLAQDIGAAAVVPVPLAINNLQKGGTDLTFCYVNDFHPNQTTAYLTSNMFYAAITKQTPVGLDFNTVTETNSKDQPEGKDPDGGDATVVFEGETKSLLQKAAYDAVMQFNQSL